MTVSYKKLLKLLIDRNMKKKELHDVFCKGRFYPSNTS